MLTVDIIFTEESCFSPRFILNEDVKSIEYLKVGNDFTEVVITNTNDRYTIYSLSDITSLIAYQLPPTI